MFVRANSSCQLPLDSLPTSVVVSILPLQLNTSSSSLQQQHHHHRQKMRLSYSSVDGSSFAIDELFAPSLLLGVAAAEAGALIIIRGWMTTPGSGVTKNKLRAIGVPSNCIIRCGWRNIVDMARLLYECSERRKEGRKEGRKE